MPPVPYTVRVRDHQSSTKQEIDSEPNWHAGHAHRIGYKNADDRKPGLTHEDDEYQEEIDEARREFLSLKSDTKAGKLVNFRDVVERQEDFQLEHPENRPLGWRYVLRTTEDFIKKEEDWPANIKRRKVEEEKKQKEAKQQDDRGADKPTLQEHEHRRQLGEGSKHHDAYSLNSNNNNNGGSDSGYEDDCSKESTDTDVENKSERERLSSKYSPQELALLRALQHEKTYISHLTTNSGHHPSPQTNNRSSITIDQADQFTPDNWLPRSADLIRLTGKHPLNAEPPLTRLFEAGLITPNELHYVRNHGAVPRLLWEFHKLEVALEAGGEGSGNNKSVELSMEQLKQDFEHVNIPVALACDGNRRKELNLVRKSKGFNWGAGAVSCAYWKGPLLRDVLVSTGILDLVPSRGEERWWVHFAGADSPSEGTYETCIPFEYAVDPANDVLLALFMNDCPLPPDHGYPVRVIVPGYVGGRCVKWVKKIWISDRENDSHYHIWDNRVLPTFITEKDGEFAEALFRHPDTACNEQNLNSVIVRPAQGEKIMLGRVKRGQTYRIMGYAYDGGGHAVQRVEVSLDGGETWLYCIRKFPDRPIRHGSKFWTWCHWHVDVELAHLVRARSIAVRCFNVFKNTQPKDPVWNVMGMMNNCWYVVRPEIVDPAEGEDETELYLLFRHPTEPGTKDGGWMKPSEEVRIAAARQEAGTPQKSFTRMEIENHDSEEDCWIVVDGKVYDATSVLAWHPGGKSAILGHAGKVHQETSDEFASIHDDYAYDKLKECVIGTVTEKAANFIKQSAEAAVKNAADAQQSDDKLALQKHRWVPVKLLKREHISEDSRTYTFQLPPDKPILGLGTCQHVQVGFHMEDKMLVRSYTPTRPVLPPTAHDNSASGASVNGGGDNNETPSLADGAGTFDLTIKTYLPTEDQPGGALSNILDVMPLGEEVEIRGPTGEIVYNGHGNFVIEGQEAHFDRVSLVLGGSGLTPGYSLIARVLLSQNDKTRLRVVDANKAEGDILLRDELDGFEKKSGGQLKITHVLSHPSEEWKGEKGHVDGEILRKSLFEPGEGAIVFLCGPPAMIQKAALPALKDWGYEEDKNMFGF